MLTGMQEQFCAEYLIDQNAYQAAVRAGYAPDTAKNASLWLKEGSRDYCPELSRHLAAMLERKTVATIAAGNEVLERLTRVLRREETERVAMRVREETPTLCGDGKWRVKKTERVEVVPVPAKLSDVNRAAELLGKAHGLWRESLAVTVQPPVIVDDVPGGGK